MTKNKIFFFSLIIFFALATFFLGNYFVNNTMVIGNGNDYLLANNSLINRFSAEVEEKTIKPTGVTKLSNDAGLYPALSPNKSELFFYSPQNGLIRSLSLSGSSIMEVSSSKIVSKIKPDLTDLIWSRDGKEIIARDQAGFVYYNLSSNISKKLNANFKKIIFRNFDSGSDANTVFLLGPTDNDSGGVYIGTPLTDIKKRLLNTRLDDWQISWLSPQKISLLGKDILFLLGTESGELEKVLENKPSLGVKWSPSGNKFIYSFIDKNSPSAQPGLYYLNIENQNEINLNLAVGASSCTWDGAGLIIYCATKSSFVYFDSLDSEGSFKLIAENPYGDNVSNLIINDAYNYLIFQEKNSNKFYGLYFTR